MPLTAADIDTAQQVTTTVKAQPPVAAHFAAAKAASDDADKVRRVYLALMYFPREWPVLECCVFSWLLASAMPCEC